MSYDILTKLVWEEQWDEDGGCVDLLDENENVIGRIGNFSGSILLPEAEALLSVERATLAAAAPAMARALCIVEWCESEDDLKVLQCSWCMQTEPNHQGYCGLDKALTQAGLDNEAREIVREMQFALDNERLGTVMPHRPHLRLVLQKKDKDDE